MLSINSNNLPTSPPSSHHGYRCPWRAEWRVSSLHTTSYRVWGCSEKYLIGLFNIKVKFAIQTNFIFKMAVCFCIIASFREPLCCGLEVKRICRLNALIAVPWTLIVLGVRGQEKFHFLCPMFGIRPRYPAILTFSGKDAEGVITNKVTLRDNRFEISQQALR